MATKGTMKKSVVKEGTHKCLLYWHDVGGGSIPTGKDKSGKNTQMLIRGGWNTFDSDKLQEIVKQCAPEIKSGLLTFWGIKIDVDGNARETGFLSDISATELRQILQETTNLDTIADLGNPDVVGAKNQDMAARRMDEIENATGLEEETIDQVDTSKL